ncbi:leucine-rich repeat-containing protein 56 [Sorex fumeus]|uniref:leucine-rich repeat-containing protein 56 n=1 Tax=Sorex fumeus TaxID=62283 RepID=UPI0024AC8C0D|nr:leucine-rich repeat-containing protein 56 [Sorex fumeus]
MLMDLAWDSVPGPRPSTARVRVRELGWQGWHNPRPQSKDEGSPLGGLGELLMEDSLSPARLKAIAQVDDLRQVSRLELCADTRQSSLGNFGVHLPNLRQLKLSGSRLGSVRDLGTSLGHLQVLWLARCGLSDLDGIGSFPALKELYVSYNDISDLSPLCLLETLEVLDLEGNSVEELGQVRYLHLCPRLAMLTLEGNPVCLRPGPGPAAQPPQQYNYRAEVRRLLPQLQVLDEVPATQTEPATPRLGEDWLMVKEAIKASSAQDPWLPRLDHASGPPIWRLGPEQSWPESLRLRPLSLLVPRSPLGDGSLPEDPNPEEDASNLTHGAGPVLCGNPTKGLWRRRRQCQAWAPLEQCPQEPGGPTTGAGTPSSERAESHELLATAGLQAWRELCLRPLPQKLLDSLPEVDPTLESPGGGPKEQEPPCPLPPSVAPGSGSDQPATQGEDPHHRRGLLLTPAPPRAPPRPGLGSGGPKELQFRGRRLRALGSLGPVLDQELAAVSALKALRVGSGPSLRGRPGPKPAPDSGARPQVSGTCHT